MKPSNNPVPGTPSVQDPCLPLSEFILIRETEYINTVIKQCEGDKHKAAKLLGISLATLYRKLATPEPKKT